MTSEELQKLQAEISVAAGFVKSIRTELSRVIAGQKKLSDRLLTALLANGHTLLEGVPGLAKTLIVKSLAQCLDGSFSRIQFTPDLLPADVTGTNIYNPTEHTFSIRKGPVFANILLADEINRAPAKVQSALLECMQERQATIAGETFQMPKPFFVMATQNPIEQEGTYPLPEAQTDRFLFKLKIDYPARSEERIIAETMSNPDFIPSALPVAKLSDILEARKYIEKIYMDPKVLEYILDIVYATRPSKHSELSERQSNVNLKNLAQFIETGASPRATVAFVTAAKCVAFIEGRAYVIPQDIKELAYDILRHRIRLSYEAEAENIDSDSIVSIILDELKTP